jgi:hypothetical protein
LLDRVQHLLADGEQILHYRLESRGAIRDVTVNLGPPVTPQSDATL